MGTVPARQPQLLADNVRLDYPAVVERKARVVKTLTDGVASLLKANGVTVVDGHARFVGRQMVEVVGVGEAPLGDGGPRYNAPAAGDGRPLARLEGQEVFKALPQRFPTLELTAEPQHREHFVLRGYQAVEVTAG